MWIGNHKNHHFGFRQIEILFKDAGPLGLLWPTPWGSRSGNRRRLPLQLRELYADQLEVALSCQPSCVAWVENRTSVLHDFETAAYFCGGWGWGGNKQPMGLFFPRLMGSSRRRSCSLHGICFAPLLGSFEIPTFRKACVDGTHSGLLRTAGPAKSRSKMQIWTSRCF